MIYNAPITDFIPKSTFVQKDSWGIYYSTNPANISGWGIANPGDQVAFIMPQRSSIWTLTGVTAWFLPIASRTPEYLSFSLSEIVSGANWTSVDTVSNENLGATTINDFFSVDVFSLMSGWSADEVYKLYFTYSASGAGTALYATSVISTYSLT